MSLFSATKVPLLGKALDAYALRQKVIGSNVANLTTSGYRARTVRFDEELRGAMQEPQLPMAQTDAQHLTPSAGEPASPGTEIQEQRSGRDSQHDPMASGFNDVDIDHEMSELAKNQIRFKYAARMLSDTFKGIQKSIRGQL